MKPRPSRKQWGKLSESPDSAAPTPGGVTPWLIKSLCSPLEGFFGKKMTRLLERGISELLKVEKKARKVGIVID